MDSHDAEDVGQFLFRLMTFRSQGDRAPRPGEETPDGLRIIAHSGHMPGLRSQK